ncbi:hypothetical protein NEOC65_000510 [Neochlamydia sp. AcF65]|nr:hypothetical protein [Neochlamydia sp. AcF65]MBS4169419.1 hypothetical protein [Neochlamydia sp. AcF95]
MLATIQIGLLFSLTKFTVISIRQLPDELLLPIFSVSTRSP